jgi:hypothetical protein
MQVTHLPFLAMGKLSVYVLIPRQPKMLIFNISHAHLLCNLYAPLVFPSAFFSRATVSFCSMVTTVVCFSPISNIGDRNLVP